MLLGVSTPTLLAAAAAIVAGVLIHELSHWVFGRIFGADPFFDRKVAGVVPTQVDYENPHAMTDRQTQVTAGLPMVCLALVPAAAWLNALVPVAFLASLGYTVSATDLVALYHPEMWKDLTAGEPVTRAEWE